jgi:hypothetical protein
MAYVWYSLVLELVRRKSSKGRRERRNAGRQHELARATPLEVYSCSSSCTRAYRAAAPRTDRRTARPAPATCDARGVPAARLHGTR